MSIFRNYDARADPLCLSKLDFEVEGPYEFPLVWILAHSFLFTWNMRQKGKIANMLLTRASLVKKIVILRKSRYKNEATLIEEIMMNN